MLIALNDSEAAIFWRQEARAEYISILPDMLCCQPNGILKKTRHIGTGCFL
jgi:hypothetical protein